MPSIFSLTEMPRAPAVSAKASPLALPPASYELALAELERLVQQMESGQLPLDELLDGYRRGAELLAYCRARLQAVEDQVRLLEDGQLKPFQGSAGAVPG
jgi:exodeoxyribonuclease VII small subunit